MSNRKFTNQDSESESPITKQRRFFQDDQNEYFYHLGGVNIKCTVQCGHHVAKQSNQFQHQSQPDQHQNSQQSADCQEDSIQQLSHITYEHSSDHYSINVHSQSDVYEHSNNSFNQYYYSSNAYRYRVHGTNTQEYNQNLVQEIEESVQSKVKGLQAEQISRIPILKWSSQNAKRDNNQNCSICLSKYKIESQLRVLGCLHRFHQGCLDIWLKDNRTCPSCRRPALFQA